MRADLLASSYPNAHLILADHGSKVKDMAAQRESMKNVQAEECDALDAAQVREDVNGGHPAVCAVCHRDEGVQSPSYYCPGQSAHRASGVQTQEA